MKREIQSVQIPDEYFKMQYMDMKTGLDDGKYYEKIYEDDTKYFNISTAGLPVPFPPFAKPLFRERNVRCLR